MLAANDRTYVAGFTAYRARREPEWCGVFARATRIACEGAVALGQRIEELKSEWRAKAGEPRADSAECPGLFRILDSFEREIASAPQGSWRQRPA